MLVNRTSLILIDKRRDDISSLLAGLKREERKLRDDIGSVEKRITSLEKEETELNSKVAEVRRELKVKKGVNLDLMSQECGIPVDVILFVLTGIKGIIDNSYFFPQVPNKESALRQYKDLAASGSVEAKTKAIIRLAFSFMENIE